MLSRQLSRGELRRAAIRAFHQRVRSQVQPIQVRPADPGETPLSHSEISFGLLRGLLSSSIPTKSP